MFGAMAAEEGQQGPRSMSRERAITWLVEATTDKRESTKLYFHVLENLLQEIHGCASLHVCFLYVLTSAQGTSGRFERSSRGGGDEEQAVQGLARLAGNENLEPLASGCRKWWASNAERVKQKSPAMQELVVSTRTELNQKRRFGILEALKAVGASRLYMTGKKSLLGKSLDKDSDYCSINLPSNCELVVVQNGERVRHLALRYEAYSVNKVAEKEEGKPPPIPLSSARLVTAPILSDIKVALPEKTGGGSTQTSSSRDLSRTSSGSPSLIRSLSRPESFGKRVESLNRLYSDTLQMHEIARDVALFALKTEEEKREAEQKALELEKKLEDSLRGSNRFSRNVVEFRDFTSEEIADMCDGFDSSKVLGEGGYGTVYRGTYAHTPVAIKKFKELSFSTALAEFTRESEVHARLRHPNIVLLMGLCQNPACLVYEYMGGGSLLDKLSMRPGVTPLRWYERISIVHDICLGLLYLHTRDPPIVHLDVKPGNILLDKDLNAKLSDVGLAQVMEKAKNDNQSFQQMSRAVGTFGYLDPAFGTSGQFSPASDVYSLGQVIWDVLTGMSQEGQRGRGEEAIDLLEEAFEDGQSDRLMALLDFSAGQWPCDVATSLCQLAFNCCQNRRNRRPKLQPDVAQVLCELKCRADKAAEEERKLESRNRLREDRVPPEYFCPITHELMQDPVFDSLGHTYERKAIEQWLLIHDTSPTTNQKLPSKHLVPNFSLKSLISQWKEKQMGELEQNPLQ